MSSVPDDWIDRVEALLAEVLRSDATDVEIRSRSLRLRVLRTPPTSPREYHPPEESAPRSGLRAIGAPLTGVIYLRPEPGADPFIQAGERVEPGTIVGLIEAMKVFNDVVADDAGIVERIVVQDGDLVKVGDPILFIQPAAAAESDDG